LVPDDRFDALFGRVMALVPPEELQDILGNGPVGPLSAEDERKLTELVTKGFEQWNDFHDRYSKQRSEVHDLQRGAATWSDVAAFARGYLKASEADSFSALSFLWQDGEVVAAAKEASVLCIEGQPYACGDYGGMPVTRDDGARAAQLGTNLPMVTRTLRELAFPESPAGAAHVRWPEGALRPAPGPFGVLVLARQSMRWGQGSYAEQGQTIVCVLVEANGRRTPVKAAEKGDLVRTLVGATVRREVDAPPDLVRAVGDAEAALVLELRRPTEEDRAAGIVHAVTPLLAAIVS
jgi:hypothetical protein